MKTSERRVRARLGPRWLACVVLLAIGAGASPAAAAMPTKGTEILWDRYGIPHIIAADHPSLFYAYGYAQMEAHSELLLRLYAQAHAQAWAREQSPAFAPRLAAFVGGLNACASEHRGALSAEAKQVLPLTVDDVLAHCLRVIHFDWIINPAKLETRLQRVAVESGG